MSRPGVMLYFSILTALDSLTPAAAGTLLLTAMHYAQDGQEPIFEDATLAFAWALLKPKTEAEKIAEECRSAGMAAVKDVERKDRNEKPRRSMT